MRVRTWQPGHHLKPARWLERVFQYSLLSLVLVMSAVPFLWMFLSSFKPDTDLSIYPPNWIPTTWTWENVETAWSVAKFGRFFVNTTIVASGSTGLVLITCSTAGYAFARLDFPWRGALFAFVLLMLMIPWPVTIIPSYILIAKWPLLGGNDILGRGGYGLIDSYWAIILPSATGSFGIFMFRQFFRTLPPELEDAARVDGASELRVLWQIMLPLSWPAVATLAILQMQFMWNNFLWPFLVTNKEDMFVLQVGLRLLSSEYTPRPYVQLAGTTIATLPVVLIFFLGQRWYVRGIQLSGFR